VAKRKAAEMRKAERIALAIPVFLRGVDERGKEFLEFTTALNVSRGGALLATRRRLADATSVSLEIPSAPLPQMAHMPRFVRSLDGEPVRLAHANGCYLWGLKFTRPIE